MSSNDKGTKHTDPITIPSARRRPRSVSISSSSSGSATSSSPENPTTPSSSVGRLSIPSPSTSPILSYFLSQSPKSPTTGNTFPFRKFGTNPVLEEDDVDREPPVAVHARRASATIATRFTQPPSSYVATEAHAERGTNLLRRLSLGGPALAKPMADQNTRPTSPSPPPNSATTPPSGSTLLNKPRRSATISTSPRPRRAPSPMGERILKGHFDGFN